jgi:hypothetical protein
MYQTANVNVYRSDYRLLIVNTVLTLTFILMIVPMFIGWWELGRHVTLNPIEIGKAFDAPLLQGPGSNASLEKLVKIMAARELRLGEAENHDMSRKWMKIAKPVEVMTPWKLELYMHRRRGQTLDRLLVG